MVMVAFRPSSLDFSGVRPSFQETHLLKWAFLTCIHMVLFLHAAALSEIPLGSKLSVGDNKPWLSSNGDFALGFFNHSDQPNLYSVGIHFNSQSIPPNKQTVVWVAGADVTVGNESYFQLTEDGQLVLFDVFKGAPVWTSQTSKLPVVSAALYDDGNLVLLDKNKIVVWQSYDNPSDTLLPGQNLTVLKTLRAASNNSVASYYTLFMNASGQLQLRWESNVIYWTTGNPPNANVSACLTSNGTLQIRDERLKPVWSAYGEDHDDGINYRFLRLDVDGNLRIYSWIEAAQSWRSVWQAVENQCMVFATCVERRICVFNESGSPNCECPAGLTTDSNSKCLAPYQQQCKSGTTMLTYENTYLYGLYPPNDPVLLTNLQDCKSLCLNDSSCAASTYTNDGTGRCLLKQTTFFTGYSDPSRSSVSFVKKCLDPLAVDPHSNLPSSSAAGSPTKKSYRFCTPCLIAAALGTLIIFLVVQVGIGFFLYKRRKSARKKALLAHGGPNSKGFLVLSFSEIKELTGNFEHRLGPKVFRAVLPNKQPVAVKELNASITERKFRATVLKLGSIHHKNLVKVEGYCCELSHRFVIYEFVKNGSLARHIDDPKLCKKLSWKKRLEVSIGVARALCYLHTECREFVNHGCLKPDHVLLDENLEAKVTEFGLVSLKGETSSGCCISSEKDVEDFGKMVLGLVMGRQDAEDRREWAYEEWREGHLQNIVDGRIEGEVDLEEVERSLRIAFWCLQRDERMRPSMGEVVKVLEGTLTVDPPPPPFGSSPRNPMEEDIEVES